MRSFLIASSLLHVSVYSFVGYFLREAGKMGPAMLQSVEPLLPIGLNIHAQSIRCFVASLGKFSGDSIFLHCCSFL